MDEKRLKVGERVRIVRFPPQWSDPDYRVPWSTRDVYRRLMARRRPLAVDEVDDWGAWVRCQFPSRAGRMHYHFLVLDAGCWVRVVRRKRAAR